MDWYYLFKLWVVGWASFSTWMIIYITYNIIKSRKIFLTQSKEIQEKYKPFYRYDVGRWSLVESLILGITTMPLSCVIFCVSILMIEPYKWVI